MSAVHAAPPVGAPAEAHRGGLRPWAIASACFIAFALFFGNRIGFEGDDLATIFGATALETVGRDAVYRYAWQPLSYEWLSWLVERGLHPDRLTYLGNVLGMLGLSLLCGLGIRLLGGTARAAALALLLVLGIPELWITSLYFNTTALALPFFAGCLWVLHATAALPRPLLTGAMAGALYTIACLLRLDFLSAAPFVLVLTFRWRAAPLRSLTGAFAALLLVLLVLVLAKPDLPAQVAAILTRYGEGEFKWPFANSLRVLIAAIAPALLLVPILFLKRSSGALSAALRQRSAWWLLLALLPLMAPLANLYSGKYLVPFFVCLIVAVCDCIGRAANASPRSDPMPGAGRMRAAALVLGLLFLVGLPQPADFAAAPLRAMVLQPRIVAKTHDGPRTIGAYLGYAMWHRAPQSRTDFIELFSLTAHRMSACPRSTTLVMPESPWYWSVLLAQFVMRDWSLAEYDFPRLARLQSADRTIRVETRGPEPSDGPQATIGPRDFTNIVVRGSDASTAEAIRRAAAAIGQPCQDTIRAR